MEKLRADNIDKRPASNPEWGPSRLFLTNLAYKIERPIPTHPVEISSDEARMKIEQVEQKIRKFKEERLPEENSENHGYKATD